MVVGVVGFGAGGTVDSPEEGTVAGREGNVSSGKEEISVEGDVDGIVDEAVESVSDAAVDWLELVCVVGSVWEGCLGFANFVQIVTNTSNNTTASDIHNIRRFLALDFTFFTPSTKYSFLVISQNALFCQEKDGFAATKKGFRVGGSLFYRNYQKDTRSLLVAVMFLPSMVRVAE